MMRNCAPSNCDNRNSAPLEIACPICSSVTPRTSGGAGLTGGRIISMTGGGNCTFGNSTPLSVGDGYMLCVAGRSAHVAARARSPRSTASDNSPAYCLTPVSAPFGPLEGLSVERVAFPEDTEDVAALDCVAEGTDLL